MPKNKVGSSNNNPSTTFLIAGAGGTSHRKSGKTSQGHGVAVKEKNEKTNEIFKEKTTTATATIPASTIKASPILLPKESDVPEEEFNPWPFVQTEPEDLVPDPEKMIGEIKGLVAEIADKDRIIADKDRIIAELSARIEEFTKNTLLFEKEAPSTLIPDTRVLEHRAEHSLPVPEAIALEQRNENAPFVNQPEWPNIQDLQPKLDEIRKIYDQYKEINEHANKLRGNIRHIHEKRHELKEKEALEKDFISYKNEFNALSKEILGSVEYKKRFNTENLEKEEIPGIPIEETIFKFRSIIKALKIYKPGFTIINSILSEKNQNNPNELSCAISKCDANLILMERRFNDTALMLENCVDFMNGIQETLYPSSWWGKNEHHEEFKSPYETGRRSHHIKTP